MTTSVSNEALCPFTLKPISSIEGSELALINPEQSECRHKCSLHRLVSYIHDASAGSTHSCPVCLQTKVTVVCDGNVGIDGREGKVEDCAQNGIICLRYGPIHYYLSLKSSNCALSRVGAVLGVDVKRGMKIIHNGKIIYPDKTSNDSDVSEKILSISSSDIKKKRKKPSLVIMGIRKPQKTVSSVALGVTQIMITLVSLLTPRSLWGYLSWTINTTKSLLGGVCIFVQSILYPPQQ